MTSQSPNGIIGTVAIGTGIDTHDTGSWSSVGGNGMIQYHLDTSEKEKIERLEADINFLRSMMIDMYAKCPKMKRDFGGNKKKVNKDDAVECENCGGLLW